MSGFCLRWFFKCQPREKGQTVLMSSALVVSSLMMGVFAVDMPLFYNYQNQLQTSVNAAALAGAAKLPSGTSAATAEAQEYAELNPVVGNTPQLDIKYLNSQTMTMEVSGKVEGPTVTGKLLCSMLGAFRQGEFDADADPHSPQNSRTNADGTSTSTVEGCDYMTIKASAKAVPAARDTIIVIDNSSSMNSYGGGRPLSDVKKAAVDFTNTVLNLNNPSVDRIGYVSFAYNTTNQAGLRSTQTDPSFSTLKSTINALALYNAKGWNTNYEAGLKSALDELQSKGRPNAQKLILFMTDGLPNLPAPPSYYTYSTWEPYRKCTDPVHNATQVKALCTKNSKGQVTSCPTLPDAKITDSMISTSAVTCGTTYKDFMVNAVHSQVARAEQMGVTIHTIQIVDPNDQDNATQVLRRLIKTPGWNPALLDYMADHTDGLQYSAKNYEASRISQIYQDIAKDIRIRLAS